MRQAWLYEEPTQCRRSSDLNGVRTMSAYLILREHVIKPPLAGVIRPQGRLPKVISPLDQHDLNLRYVRHVRHELN